MSWRVDEATPERGTPIIECFLSNGIEPSATGESLNSGDVAVHPAARHIYHLENSTVAFSLFFSFDADRI